MGLQDTHSGAPLRDGVAVLIMTVTQYFTGTVNEVLSDANSIPQYVLLDDVTWIADTGKLSECLSGGRVREAQICAGPVAVSLPACVATFHWRHNLPVPTTVEGRPSPDRVAPWRGAQGSPVKVGAVVFIMTVTQYFTGKIVDVTCDDNGSMSQVLLEDATWIADTGKLSEFLAGGTPRESQRCEGLTSVSLGAVVAIFHWQHTVPVPTCSEGRPV